MPGIEAAADEAYFLRTESAPLLPPPPATVGVVGWLRTRLFSSITSTVLTLAALYLLWLVIPPLIDLLM